MTNPKKKSGGQPNNLSASKDARAIVKRLVDGRPVPLETVELQALAGEMIAPFVQDLGGEEAIATGQRLLLDGLTALVSVRLAILQDMVTYGAVVADKVTGTRGLQPAVEKLSTFIGQESRIIRALGLVRKPRSVSDLDAYLTQKQETAEKEKETK